MSAPISIKTLIEYIKRNVSTDPILKFLSVEGEISSISKKTHTYIVLKEGNYTISCVFFGDELNFNIGDKVIVSGTINLYERDGKIQLVAKSVNFTGEGEYFIKLELLKQKLFNEGIFDPKYKKSIKSKPFRIGLITAETGAVISDFMLVINENNYPCEITLYPAHVQGIYASEDNIKGLRKLDSLNLDVIVLIRGGGSKEDLMPYNNEELVREIFNTNTPVITGIGHEVDLSLADLVSDKYFSTPTKLAEHIVKDFNNDKNNLKVFYDKINRNIESKIFNLDLEIKNIFLNIENKNPLILLEKLSDNINRLNDGIYSKVQNKLNVSISSIATISNIISSKHNNTLKNKSIFIKNTDGTGLNFEELNVERQYIIFKDNTEYLIEIKDKINGK